MRTSVRKSITTDYTYEFLNIGDIEFKNNGHYVDNRLSLITQPTIPFIDKELEIKELLNSIIDIFGNDVKYFRFDNPHEIFNWKHFWDLFKIIHEVFEDRGIVNRLVFADNNPNFKFKNNKWKYEGFPYLLGWPILDNKLTDFDSFITNKKFHKHFLSLNRRPKNFREELVQFLVDSGLSEKSYYSFGVDGLSDSHHLHKILDTTFSHIPPSDAENFNFTGLEDNSFCHIITESDIDNVYTTENKELDSKIELNNNLHCHFSEKTTRAISAGMPFVIISSALSLETLKYYGFKTFSDWWDESYDLQLNWNDRFEKIKEVLLYISSKSTEECFQIYKEMIPTIIHNRKLHDELKSKYNFFDKMDIVEVHDFPNEEKYFELFKIFRNK